MFAVAVTERATTVNLPNLPSFFTSTNWAAPTWDLFIFVFFIGVTVLYAFSLGRSRLATILVSTYISLAVVTNLPFVDQLARSIGGGRFFAFRTLVFMSIFTGLFFFLSRSNFLRSIGEGDSGSWWQIAIFSFLHVGLLTCVILSFLPAGALSHLSILTRAVFTENLGKSFWLIAPLLAIIGTRIERSY